MMSFTALIFVLLRTILGIFADAWTLLLVARLMASDMLLCIPYAILSLVLQGDLSWFVARLITWPITWPVAWLVAWIIAWFWAWIMAWLWTWIMAGVSMS